MTAEVIILNRQAVALAADSAVTLDWGNGRKIFNTGNKLFALSKYRPVGVMVYGNANFMGLPWESIIKHYRSRLGKTAFSTLEEYIQHFIAFLENEDGVLWSVDTQADAFRNTIASFYFELVKKIDKLIKDELEKHGTLTPETVSTLVASIIAKQYERWTTSSFLPRRDEACVRDIAEKFGDGFKELIDDIFEKLPLSDDTISQLAAIGALLPCKDRFPDSVSGVVIAGFGEREIFPSAVSFTFDSVAFGRLKYKILQRACADREHPSYIMPFAQSEMVQTFIEGIDPSFRQTVLAFLTDLTTKYPELILNAIPDISHERRVEVKEGLQAAAEKMQKKVAEELQGYAQVEYIEPVLQAVAALPKDELAAMAESLVNLTSFKRRVSLQAETVGGPIDVAVISKGDGFVWIKRKHYFNANLNQTFFSNYYRED